MIRAASAAIALLLACAGPVAFAADEALPEDSLLDEDQDARMGAAEARRILEAPLPTRGAPDEGEALVQRQRAAFALGDAPARTAALQRLVEATETREKPSPWAMPLWRELARTGNQTAALEMGEKLADDRRFSPVAQATIVAMLGQDYTVFGNNDGARRALARAEAAARQLTASDDFLRRELPIHVDHLRAAIRQSEGNLGAAEEAIRAAYDASVKEVERSRQMPAGRARDLRSDAAIRMRTGQMRRYVSILMAEGKHVEAENLAQLGVRLGQEEKTGGTMTGLWQSRVAFAKVGQRRYLEALEAAQQAVDTLAAAGAAPSSDRMIFARVYQLQALFGLARWGEADQVMARMRADAGEDRLARLLIDSPVLQSFLHLVNGRKEEALQRIEPSVRYRARNHGETHPSTIEAKAMRAMVFQAQSRTREALADYREVFASVFGPDTSFADAEPAGLRGFVMPHVLGSYLRLVATAYREGGGKLADPEMASESFRVADRLRASVVQQALIDSSARAAASNPRLAELIRREQDLRSKQRESMTQLVRQFADDARATREFQERQKAKRDEKDAAAERERIRARDAAVRARRGELAAGEEARRETLRELRKRFPEYQALVNPKPPTLREAAEALRAGEALVSLFPTAEGTFAWAVASRREPAFHFSPLKAADVAELVASMRKTLDPDESGGPARLPFDFPAAARLHRDLVAPLWGAVEGSKTLVVAANGALAQVPLAALVTREGAADLATAPWLVRQVAIAQLTSVASFQALRQSPARSAGKPFVGFGDPAFREYADLPPLPETRTEILAIAQALGADPERDVYLGTRATRKAVLTADLEGRRVVAFATHGLKPRDLPGLSRPALAMAAAPAGDSPLLQLDDVMTLRLDAELVVLSACNTAGADGRAEEALSGLARGFFFAGGRSVLATHWAVETLSAEQLVRRMFGHVAKSVPRAEALRRAQLDLIDGRANPAFRHPFYWAPYALSGDPG